MNWQGIFSNKKRVWAVLGVIWAAIIAYNAGHYIKGPSSEAPLETRTEGLKVRLDLLKNEKRGYGGIKKDIFSPLRRVTPVVKPVEVQPAPPPPPPPTALQVFIMTVRALGFVEKEKDKTVFLSKNDELFIAKSGDLVDGRFRILSITETALKVRDEVTKEESVIAIAVQ
ncbi:MAG: hypothetical protein AAB210_05530 [Deltaproteobacteria bacterium]